MKKKSLKHYSVLDVENEFEKNIINFGIFFFFPLKKSKIEFFFSSNNLNSEKEKGDVELDWKEDQKKTQKLYFTGFFYLSFAKEIEEYLNIFNQKLISKKLKKSYLKSKDLKIDETIQKLNKDELKKIEFKNVTCGANSWVAISSK